jgi:hypothetical protein
MDPIRFDVIESLDEEERRDSKRRPAADFPDLSAKLVAGPSVKLINLSRQGVLLESALRLLPGAKLTIRFNAADATLVLKGCVVRSSVAVVGPGMLLYHTGVALEAPLTLWDDDVWGPVDVEEPASSPEEPCHEVLTLVATCEQNRDELSHLLVANDW